MGIDLNAYLSNSIDRFRIKKVGYLPESRIPFIILEDDLVFYGIPRKNEKIFENILIGIVETVKDLEYRYFQSNRELKQHSRYHYKPGDVVVELGT